MDSLVRLLELAYSSESVYISDVMRLGFRREVQEEESWLSFLRGWCVYVEDRLAYLDAVILELELCSNHTSVAQVLVQLRNGDDVVFADAIMYFKVIRDFEADKLAKLHLFLQISTMHVALRREFVGRFTGV
ncbi:hypothetical protein CTI12_AA394160 [Artemisia annua]|uniref:Uncharacterized protein n=1 Tax=Artemisia annua TaxID=35608 RepID=A0A2U1MCW8_ARTAN|nr:hypothetical protein CTI12_AA394160 [Artemisia annua]